MDHHRVLVADRNATFLEKTAEILNQIGVQMLPINNGQQAISLCRHEQPDAVLLNEDLVALPGTETCQRIKSQVDPALPVVLMFHEERPELDQTLQKAGADNYLIRPLKRSELLFCVRSLLELRRIFREQKAKSFLAAQGEGLGPGVVDLNTFYSFLTLEVKRVERYGFPLALLHVGIDPLPEDIGIWGDTLAYQLGPALAQLIRSCLRDIDISAVLAPREMLVLMPHTDSSGARVAAGRICSSISAQSYHFGRIQLQPTVSVGGAFLHGRRKDPQELLATAKASFERISKNGGNNFQI